MDFDTEEPVAPELKKIKKVAREVPTNTETPTEVVEETPTEVVEETPTEVVEETPTEVVEETPTEVVEETPTDVVELDESPMNVSDSKTVLDDMKLDTATPGEEVEVTEDPVEDDVPEPTKVVEEKKPEVIDLDEVINTDIVDNKNETTIDETIIEPTGSTDITKKLLKDLEVRLNEDRVEQTEVKVIKPVSAPSYESLGSGLVYNCVDGHWACIDSVEYNKCRENYSWNKSEGIPIECYPYAYLDVENECSVIQQEKIDAVTNSSFCL